QLLGLSGLVLGGLVHLLGRPTDLVDQLLERVLTLLHGIGAGVSRAAEEVVVGHGLHPTSGASRRHSPDRGDQLPRACSTRVARSAAIRSGAGVTGSWSAR